MSLFMILKIWQKRREFLKRKKRVHLGCHFKTKMNCQKPKKKRLERHYKEYCLETIELGKRIV